MITVLLQHRMQVFPAAKESAEVLLSSVKYCKCYILHLPEDVQQNNLLQPSTGLCSVYIINTSVNSLRSQAKSFAIMFFRLFRICLELLTLTYPCGMWRWWLLRKFAFIIASALVQQMEGHVWKSP